jgi:hypothetical protein
MQHSAAADGLFYNNTAPVTGQLEYRNASGNPVFYTNFVNGNGYFSGNLGIKHNAPPFPLSFGPALGDKISLWSNSANSYGFGIQGSRLQIHTDISAADIVFGYGSSATMTETMRIKGTGLVGIGTSSPAEKLQVSGNIKADTVKPTAIKLTPNAGTGKVLTSDASGNASWQDKTGQAGFGSWGDCSVNGISEYLPAADASGAFFDNFGSSTSISGNFAIVGSPGDDIERGSASIYQFDGTNWTFMQELADATGEAGDRFGAAVSISGSHALIGAPYDQVGGNSNQGSVCFFQYNGSSWVLVEKITDLTGGVTDGFGSAVCISGIYAVVGSPTDSGPALGQGSASVYIYNGSNWLLMQKLIDPTGEAFDFFGYSVSVSNNNVVVGAPNDAGTAGSFQGSASLFTYDGSCWMYMQKLTLYNPAAASAFGSTVSISGNYIIVGSPGESSETGCADIFMFDGSGWPWSQRINNPAGMPGDNFGSGVFMSGDYAIVGAIGDDIGPVSNQGSATILVRVGIGWQRLQFFSDPAGNQSDNMGSAISVDGTNKRFIVGVQFYATQAGKVIFGKIN